MQATHPVRNTARLFVALVPLTIAGFLAADALHAQSAVPQRQVTFTKDIAPILQRSCQGCHRPNGGIAPMALTTYEEVRPWVRSIKLKTSRREMPPWFVEKTVGIQHFKDDNSLSDAEIATIGRWADAGAPRGNSSDMPPPLKFDDHTVWKIGEPDLILSSPVRTVPAIGPDQHPPFIGSVPTGLTEDRWIASWEAREVKVGDRPDRASGGFYLSIHHQAISAGVSGSQNRVENEGGETADGGRNEDNFGYTYEVGQNAQYMPPDVGVALKAGSVIHFSSAHFHSIGEEVKVQLQVAFKFHPKGYTPKYPNRWKRTPSWGLGGEIDIPGNTRITERWVIVLNEPRKLVSFEPHLHAGGRRMCAEAFYPDTRRETINCVGYNHAWVKSYVYEDDYAPLFPKGTMIQFTAWHDNTPANPLVADPRNWRGLGQRSIDEMFLFLGKWVTFTDDEYKVEVAARNERLKQLAATRTNQQQ